MVEKYPKDN